MDLLEEIASDEFNFIENAVDFRIVLSARNFDWVNVDCNHYIRLAEGITSVKVFCKLDGIASDLN